VLTEGTVDNVFYIYLVIRCWGEGLQVALWEKTWNLLSRIPWVARSLSPDSGEYLASNSEAQVTHWQKDHQIFNFPSA